MVKNSPALYLCNQDIPRIDLTCISYPTAKAFFSFFCLFDLIGGGEFRRQSLENCRSTSLQKLLEGKNIQFDVLINASVPCF